MIENWILAIIWIAVAIKCCWGIMGSGIKGISKTKPRMRHLINVKKPHFLCFEA